LEEDPRLQIDIQEVARTWKKSLFLRLTLLEESLTIKALFAILAQFLAEWLADVGKVTIGAAFVKNWVLL